MCKSLNWIKWFVDNTVDVLNILQWLVLCSMNIISMYKSSIIQRWQLRRCIPWGFFFSIAKDPDKSCLRERGLGGTYRHREIVYPGQEMWWQVQEAGLVTLHPYSGGREWT